MKNSAKKIRIFGSGTYAQNQERMEKLREIIVDGEDAEAVLKYAERFLAEIERETLETLKKPNADHKEAADYYRVACRFVDMLQSAVAMGKRKIETFETLKASE